MKRLGTMIRKNAFDYEVYAVPLKDRNSQRRSAALYTVSPEGVSSDLVIIQRSKMYAKKNAFNFVYNWEGQFDSDDITAIRVALFKCFDEKPVMVQEKATFDEIYTAVHNFIKINAEDLKENPEAEVFIRGDFGYIRTKFFEEFVKENKELGYKRQELLLRLQIGGALQCVDKRGYEKLVKVNGKGTHCYVIDLLKIQNETEYEDAEEIFV